MQPKILKTQITCLNGCF